MDDSPFLHYNSMYVYDAGSGIPVILIHGYPLSHGIWDEQLSLSQHYRILAPDLPGFGQTPPVTNWSISDYANFILQILDERKIGQAVVMGHSMGGYIALEFAARYQDRLSGLGLICTQAGADSDDARSNRMKTIERVKVEGTNFISDMMAEKLLSPNNLTDDPLVKTVKTILQSASKDGVMAALAAMAHRDDHFDTLEKISVPSLVITGDDDVLIPAERSEQMAAKLKQATLEKIAGAGHLAMMEKPEAFNSILSKFLKSLP
jgi:3-oxoadipate enol-lactonase